MQPVFEEYLKNGYNASMSYLARNLDKRLDPSLLVPGAKTILCFLAPYGQSHGSVAGFAQGQDYHISLKRRLFALMEYLSGEASRLGLEAFSGRAFVDSAPVLERYWAAKAGLGFIGLNNFLISPQFGLRTIICEIICNIPVNFFKAHERIEPDNCGRCGRCLQACPTGALRNGGRGEGAGIDARKCISYHTIESRQMEGQHPVDYNGWIFGCEECLKVCPWNKDTPSLKDLETNAELLESMTAEDWRKLSAEDFGRIFADSGLNRAGLEKIRHNL